MKFGDDPKIDWFHRLTGNFLYISEIGLFTKRLESSRKFYKIKIKIDITAKTKKKKFLLRLIWNNLGFGRSPVAYLQKQPPGVFIGKGVLRNFAKLTGKHLCQSLFFNKVAGLREISKNTFSTEHLWKTASLFRTQSNIVRWCLSRNQHLKVVHYFRKTNQFVEQLSWLVSIWWQLRRLIS